MENSCKNVNALVSVIVPVYNVKQYLQHCLDTITSQSYQNLEIILVDDGSTDGSGDICDTYSLAESRCVVIHQENRGVWAARNAGQKVAKGDFIIFVDGDDYLHVDMIKCLYDSLLQNPQCGFAMCKYIQTSTYHKDSHVQSETRSQIMSMEQVINMKNQTIIEVVWNKLYRRSLIDDVWSRKYRIAQDVDFNCRVFQRLEYAVLVDSVLYYWFQRSSSAMHQYDYWRAYLMTVTDIYYRNYTDCSNANKILKGYFLQKLYWRMLSLRTLSWRTEDETIAFQKCRDIIKNTSKFYLTCGRVSLLQRLYVMLLLVSPPFISYCMMHVKRKMRNR